MEKMRRRRREKRRMVRRSFCGIYIVVIDGCGCFALFLYSLDCYYSFEKVYLN